MVPRYWGTDNIIIFQLGENDSQYNKEKKKNKVNRITFKNHIIKLIKEARKFTEKVVFIGLTPVYDRKVDPIPWSPKYSYKNKFVKQYNNIIRDVCLKEKVFFIPVYTSFLKAKHFKLLVDGVHLNTKGHELLFNLIKDFLVKKKLIP